MLPAPRNQQQQNTAAPIGEDIQTPAPRTDPPVPMEQPVYDSYIDKPLFDPDIEHPLTSRKETPNAAAGPGINQLITQPRPLAEAKQQQPPTIIPQYTEEEKKESSKLFLYIFICVSVALMFGLTFYFFYRKNGNKSTSNVTKTTNLNKNTQDLLAALR